MNTMFFTTEGSVMLDENNNPISFSSDRESISRIYKLDQDCRIVYMKDDTRIELEGKAGQILVMFYANEFKNRVVLVDSKEWCENIDGERERVQKQKEEWAKKHAETDCAEADNDCKIASL